MSELRFTYSEVRERATTSNTSLFQPSSFFSRKASILPWTSFQFSFALSTFASSSWLIDPSRLLRATISMLPLLIRTDKESLLHLHFLPYLILSLLACDSMKEGSTGLPDKRYLAYQNPSLPYRLFAFRCALTNSFLPYRRLLCILHYGLCCIPHPLDCALCSPQLSNFGKCLSTLVVYYEQGTNKCSLAALIQSFLWEFTCPPYRPYQLHSIAVQPPPIENACQSVITKIVILQGPLPHRIPLESLLHSYPSRYHPIHLKQAFIDPCRLICHLYEQLNPHLLRAGDSYQLFAFVPLGSINWITQKEAGMIAVIPLLFSVIFHLQQQEKPFFRSFLYAVVPTPHQRGASKAHNAPF